MAFKALPDEIVLQIQQYLRPQERLQTARINRQWRSCAEDEPYWRRAFQADCLDKRFKGRPSLPEGVDSWRQAYRMYGEAMRAQSNYYQVCKQNLMQPFRRMVADDLGSMFDPSADIPWEMMLAGIGICGMASNWYFETTGCVWRAYGYTTAGVFGTGLGAWLFDSTFLVHTLSTIGVSFWAVGSLVLGPTYAAVSVLKHIPAYSRAWRFAETVNADLAAQRSAASNLLDDRYGAYKALVGRVEPQKELGDG